MTRDSSLAFYLSGVLIAVTLTSALAQDAPFGFAWGSVDKIPKPWTAQREANITSLFYDRSSSFAAAPDTDQVIVEICRTEGLQEVIWVSRHFSPDELSRKFQLAHLQGIERYGEPKQLSDPMTETWKDGRVFLGASKGLEGQQRLIMVMRGDLFDQCSAEHQAEAGHPAELHARNFLLHDHR